MPRARFLWKLYLGYVALILLTTTIVGILVTKQIEEDSQEETLRTLGSQAILLRELARRPDLVADSSALQKIVVAMGHRNDTRYTVIAADGIVLADSAKDPAVMDNHLHRPEVQQALREGSGSSRRFSDTVKKEMTYYALVMGPLDKPVGFARTSFFRTRTDQRLADLRALVALGAVSAAIVGLVLGWFFARKITGPLRSITSSAASIASGHYDQTVEVQSSDEIGQLAIAFNDMATHLRERIDTIEHERQEVLAILSGMVEGVIAVDNNRRVVHMNRAAGVILDVAPHRTLGMALSDVCRVQDVNGVVRQVMESAKEVSSEIRISGTRAMNLDVRAAPLKNGGGRPRGAVVVLHDITELRRLESVRRDFVGNVSHELKTPLTAIRGLVETMLDDDQMDTEFRKRFLEKTRAQTDRLSALVKDLLVLSRVESGGDSSEHEPVDLVELVGGVASLMRVGAEAKGIALEVRSNGARPSIIGDGEALEQMVTNLVSNAVTYTPAGGRIWLSLGGDEAETRLEVRDTGIGIEPQHLDRIFERFYRVDKARSRELGGTGLGLSIVKHIAIAHGGRVTVDSTPGEGTSFTVTLPTIGGSQVGSEPRSARRPA